MQRDEDWDGASPGWGKQKTQGVGKVSKPIESSLWDTPTKKTTVENVQQAKQAETKLFIQENSKPQDRIVYTDGSVTKDQSGWASRGIQYYDCIIYNFWGFDVNIIVDLVKRGVLILVSEIRRYRNDRYYYYLLSS